MTDKKPWPTQEGILYAKPPARKVKSKDGKEYEFQSIVLEIDSSYTTKDGKYIEKSFLMQFDLSKNAKSDVDRFNIGDPIIITYTMAGREYKKKDGSKGYDNKLSAWSINFSDVNSGTRKPAKAETKKEEIPVDKTDYDDLPF